VKKQGALDTALSSSYALEARLTASEERVRTLEGQLAMTDYDVESPAGRQGGGREGGREGGRGGLKEIAGGS